MPVIVDPTICNGCGTSSQPPCVRMCPGDLIEKNRSTNKAFLKYDDCWDCLACVKSCPEEAIVFRLSYQLGFPNATLQPHVKPKENTIEWEAIDANGKKEFFSIRTKVLPMDLDEKIEGTEQPDFSI